MLQGILAILWILQAEIDSEHKIFGWKASDTIIIFNRSILSIILIYSVLMIRKHIYGMHNNHFLIKIRMNILITYIIFILMSFCPIVGMTVVQVKANKQKDVYQISKKAVIALD